jgi:D-glycero-D-manno-heptose 1,7-bisphosphate phosphatase
MIKAAFIDRDGVINEDREYVSRPTDFHFIPGSVDALRTLQAAGFALVVITNQSGIARGMFTQEQYLQLQAYMEEQLAAAGVVLDSIQYCPHLPDAPVERYRLDCECRKPRAGMILAAVQQLDIDLAVSMLIGDRRADLEAGRAAGVGRCFLVRSGKHLSAEDESLADGVYADLAACVTQLPSSEMLADE